MQTQATRRPRQELSTLGDSRTTPASTSASARVNVRSQIRLCRIRHLSLQRRAGLLSFNSVCFLRIQPRAGAHACNPRNQGGEAGAGEMEASLSNLVRRLRELRGTGPVQSQHHQITVTTLENPGQCSRVPSSRRFQGRHLPRFQGHSMDFVWQGACGLCVLPGPAQWESSC